MKDNKLIIIISLGVVALLLTIGLLFIWFNLKESKEETRMVQMQAQEMQEIIALEQEEMLNDLQEVQMLYEEEKSKVISNDSLLVDRKSVV